MQKDFGTGLLILIDFLRMNCVFSLLSYLGYVFLLYKTKQLVYYFLERNFFLNLPFLRHKRLGVRKCKYASVKFISFDKFFSSEMSISLVVLCNTFSLLQVKQFMHHFLVKQFMHHFLDFFCYY